MSLLDPYNGERSRCEDVVAVSSFLLVAENRSQETMSAKASKRLEAFAGSFFGSGALASNLSKISRGSGRFAGMCLGGTERTR
jgi:hypothetical protein